MGEKLPLMKDETHPALKIKDPDVELVAFSVYHIKEKNYERVSILTNEKIKGNDPTSAKYAFKIPNMIQVARKEYRLNDQLLVWRGEINSLQDLSDIVE
ncbi:MAG: hypothetical protein ACRCVN_06165 [Spirochaetia bacterium]